MWKFFNRISDTRLSLLLALMVPTGVLVLFLPVMLVSISQIVSRGESQYIQWEVKRTENIFRNELEQLDLALLDWAAWDETYQFAQGLNPTYIERNLPNSTFSNLEMDVFLVLDPAGEVILAKYVDQHTQVEAPLPFSVDDLLQAYPAILDQADLTTGQKGLVLINQQAMLLTARPILTNEQEGPAQGTLIYLRQIDTHELVKLSQLNMREVYIYDLNHLPSDIPHLPDPVTLQEQIFVQPLNADIGAGFKYLDDLNGTPVLVLSVQNPRLLSIQGRMTAWIFSILFLALSLLLFGAAFFFSRSLLTFRKASRRYLERYQAVVQQSSEAILVVRPDWTMVEGNPTSEQLLAIVNDPNHPTNLKDLLTFQPELNAGFLHQASQEGSAAEYRCIRHDGHMLDVELVASQIADGDTMAFSLNIHDISSRKTAEQALRESEARYRLLFENNPLPMWIYDRKTLSFLEVNDTAVQKYGYTREEFLGMTVADIRPAEDVPRFMEFVRSSRTALRHTGGWRHCLKNGDIIDVEITSHLLHQNEGQSILVVAQDVTQRKRVEREVRSAKDLFSKLFHLSPIPSTLIRIRDLACVDINRSFEETFGYGRNEILGHPITEFDLLVDPALPERFLPSFLEQDHLRGIEFEFQTKAGEKRQASGYVEILEQDGDELILAKIIDVTERKQAEQALQASQVRFRALIENAPDGITLLNTAGRLVYVSPSTERILGYSTEDIIGHDPAEYMHPEDLPALLMSLSDLMQNPGQTITTQYRLRHKDNAWRWIESRLSNLQAEPSVNAIVFNYRDITEQKQAEVALRIKTEELEALFAVSTHLRQAQTVNEMLPLVVEAICGTLGADASAILLLEPTGRYFRMVLANGPLVSNTGWRFCAEKGISGEIFRTHQPYITEDYASNPFKLADLSGAEELGPSVLVPLQSESQFLGIVVATRLRKPEVEPFTADSVRLLTAISEMVGTALRRLSLFEDAQRRLSEVQALRKIDLTIIGSLDLQFSLRTILAHLRSRLDVDAASFLVLNPHRLALEYATGEGFQTNTLPPTSLRLGEGHAGRAAMERRTIHIPDLRNQSTDFLQSPTFQEESFVAYYAVPLMAKGQVKGVLEVFHRSSLEADAEWVEFLETLAGQAAIAIDNAGLYTDLQHSNQELVLAYDETIEGWSRALDLRDKETEGHTQRVTEMTVHLARAMGIAEAELVQVRRGALLHDIGKMGIPDHILLKPGPLTEEEWGIMRKHHFYAYQMLAPIAYLRPALDIPYCHHEKWNGSGYPRSLKGEEIPLAARIFAVVDVWDAITSNRPYRQAWSQEKALEHICHQAGQHFDQQVVEIFLKFIQNERSRLKME